MKSRLSRAVLSLGLALGVMSALAFAATNALASNEPVKPAAAPAEAWGGCWYIVYPGDTLFRIALRYGVSPYYLAQINGLYNPNYLPVGMKLIVPCDGGGKPPPPPPHQTPQPCAKTVDYVVKPGDNLFRIALNYGTTVSALRDANNLWGRVLRPGMVLKIPCPNLPTDHAPVAPQVPGQPSPTVTTPTEGGGQGPELPPEPSASIILSADKIDPKDVTIKAGESVVWINKSQSPMTIVSGFPGQPNNEFNSGQLPDGATFVHPFAAAGSYSYYINENPMLVGQIIVNP